MGQVMYIGVLLLPGDTLPRLPCEDAVLADFEAPALRPRPELDVVGLRAGEILQRRAESLGLHRAQIDLQPFLHHDRALGRAASQHPAYGGEVDKPLHHRLRLPRGYEQIHIADRLLVAPQAPGDLHLEDLGHAAESGSDLVGSR
jgi:hypothetical protein